MTHPLPPNSIPLGQAPCALLSHLPPLASSSITVGPCISGIRLSGSSQYRDFFNGHYRVKVSLITGKNLITVIFPRKSRYSRLIVTIKKIPVLRGSR